MCPRSDRVRPRPVPAPRPPSPPADNGAEITEALRAETKQQHVPFLYVAGAHMDSEKAFFSLKAKDGGELRKAIEATGVKVTGYFRP